MRSTRSIGSERGVVLLTATSTPRSPRSGSRASGERTRVEILRAAKRVLATDGYARFTLRRVAGEAGLTVGNLAYHYPSKRNLVRALIMLLIEEYRMQVDARLRSAPSRSPGAFRALVSWLIRDSVSTQTSRLFREFWTIALHDPVIANAIDRLYAEVRKQPRPIFVITSRICRPVPRGRSSSSWASSAKARTFYTVRHATRQRRWSAWSNWHAPCWLEPPRSYGDSALPFSWYW